jgi:hypothetical protein
MSCNSVYKKFLNSLEHLVAVRENFENITDEEAKNDYSLEESVNETISAYSDLDQFVCNGDPDGIGCELPEIQKEISNLANSVDASYHLPCIPDSRYDKTVRKALFPLSSIKALTAKAKSLHGRVCKVEECNPFLRCYGPKGFFTSYDRTKVAPFANHDNAEKTVGIYTCVFKAKK